MARDPVVPPVRLAWAGGDPAWKAALEAGAVVWVDDPAAADLVLSPPGTPAAEPGNALDDGGLTDREAEVLSYLADGWSNDEIADRLAIGARTVKFHLDRLYRKLGVHRRTEAVREAATRGFLRF